MGYFLAITCLLLLALLLGLLLTFFISLIRGLLKLRRVAWIAVRPEVVATLPEHLSPYLADFFAVAAPQLTRKGFVAVASGHTPRFSGRASRTHAVYVNPQTGERAGI